MSMIPVTQSELEVKFPQAFAALPEPYQADSCLEFYIDCNSNICCAPKADQVNILGNWECMFDAIQREWILIPIYPGWNDVREAAYNDWSPFPSDNG